MIAYKFLCVGGVGPFSDTWRRGSRNGCAPSWICDGRTRA